MLARTTLTIHVDNVIALGAMGKHEMYYNNYYCYYYVNGVDNIIYYNIVVI